MTATHDEPSRQALATPSTAERREILNALDVAPRRLGATAKATTVDRAWQAFVDAPITFLVDDCDAILDPRIDEPDIMGEVYPFLLEDGLDTRDELLDAVGAVPLLQDQVSDLAFDMSAAAQEELAVINAEIEDLRARLAEDLLHEEGLAPDVRARLETSLAAAERRRDADDGRLATLADLDASSDEPWQVLIAHGDEEQLAAVRDAIVEFCESPFDPQYKEQLPPLACRQWAAFERFGRLPGDVLGALGVVIVDKEHPHSTWWAAELLVSTRTANAAARRLGIPIRFGRLPPY